MQYTRGGTEADSLPGPSYLWSPGRLLLFTLFSVGSARRWASTFSEAANSTRGSKLVQATEGTRFAKLSHNVFWSGDFCRTCSFCVRHSGRQGATQGSFTKLLPTSSFVALSASMCCRGPQERLSFAHPCVTYSRRALSVNSLVRGIARPPTPDQHTRRATAGTRFAKLLHQASRRKLPQSVFPLFPSRF